MNASARFAASSAPIAAFDEVADELTEAEVSLRAGSRLKKGPAHTATPVLTAQHTEGEHMYSVDAVLRGSANLK
jgi:hypothetical protein